MRVGLGTGSTVYWFLQALGARVAAGLSLTGVATSESTAAEARRLGIPLAELGAEPLDLAVDGADCADPDLRLIKGGGGAQVRERIVAAAANRFVVIVDESKWLPALRGPIPVEVLDFGHASTVRLLEECTGAACRLRPGILSDTGNLLGDIDAAEIADPEGLAAELDAVPGLVGHGLFLGMADEILIGSAEGTVRSVRPREGRPRPFARQ